MMRIDEAMLGIEVLEWAASGQEVAGVQYDSRRVKAGDIFVAMRGETTDGNRYIESAVARGVAVVVTDSASSMKALSGQAPGILVRNGRRALAGITANLLGHPERALKVSAVTGTNGKTTTAFLLEQMLRSVGRKCVLVGTIETHVGDEVRASEHTTPEASDLLGIFADGVAAGATEAVMEMSSHALEQERVWGVPVDVGIFTNLTQDHLDYHGTMEAYAAAKAKLFAGVGAAPPRVAVVNVEDGFGRKLLSGQFSGQVMSYGIGAGNFRAEALKLEGGRTSFDWKTPDGTAFLESTLTGRVNVYNLMASSCAALARGMSLHEIEKAVHHLDHVPGRFQVVNGSYGAGFTVVVDYAHTEDALRNLIAIARDLVRLAGARVITMFGCGGDRDKTKRPKMGYAAGVGSDLVIVTSDNPRSEDPLRIIDDILPGVVRGTAEWVVEPDRTKAIQLAVSRALPGDIVLLAGKGHEKVQVLDSATIPFDDAEVAGEALLPILREVKADVLRARVAAKNKENG